MSEEGWGCMNVFGWVEGWGEETWVGRWRGGETWVGVGEQGELLRLVEG